MTTRMFEDRPAKFRVYLDGVDVPFKKISIQESAQMPSQATIDVPPHPILNNIPPKALVHVFYQEQVIKAQDEKSGQSARGPQSGWKLLYEGEMTGIGFSRSSNSRSTQLQFEGIANWIRTATGAQAGMSQMFGPNSQTMPLAGMGGSKVNASSQQIKTSLEDKWKQKLQRAESLVDGVRNIIEEVIDTNIVLDGAEKRVSLLDRLPDVDPSNHMAQSTFSKFINLDSIQEMLKQEMGRVKNRRPILNLLQVVLSPTWHEMGFNSSLLSGWMVKPMIRFAPPPSCNVLTPKMISTESFSHNFLKEPTRMFLQRTTGGQQTNGYVWPDEIDWEKFLNIATGDFSASEIDDRQKYVLTEEMLKGVVPGYEDYSHANYEAASKNTEGDNWFFTQAAENEHHINKLNSSQFTTAGGFNPEPVPGFPIMVADPSFDVVFGYLGQVNHTITNKNLRTTYNIQLGQRTLSNPRNLSAPNINPIYAESINVDGNQGKENLQDFYADFINADVEENDDNRVEMVPRDSDLEDAWHDKKDFPKNPVLGRSLTLMRSVMRDNSDLDRSFFRRGHMTPKQVFEGFYDTKPMQSGQLPNMWGNVIHDGIGDGDIKSLPQFLKSDDSDVQNKLIKRRKDIEHYVMFLNQQGGSKADTNVWPPDMDPGEMEHGLLADYGSVEEHE